MKFKDATDRAVRIIPALKRTFANKRRILLNARAKIFSRVSHPSNLFQGESYNVDLTQPRFEGTMDGAVVSFGPVQLIGTYVQSNSSWLWGWNNPSISEIGYSEIRSAIEKSRVLKDISACERFDCEELFVDDMATFAATEAGYLGAYPAPTGEAIAYLALKLVGTEGRGYEWKDNYWCCVCGRWPDQVDKIIASPEEMYVCSSCIDSHLEVAAELDDDAIETEENVPDMPGCLLCGRDDGKRIFADYSSLCLDCIAAAHQMLIEEGVRTSAGGKPKRTPGRTGRGRPARRRR